MIVKYVDWGKHLRLGNWLFVYAGLQSIFKHSENQLCFPDSYFLWKYLQEPPIQITADNFDEVFHFRTMEHSPAEKQYLIDFFRDTRETIVNINLGSHLQSEKWFIEDKDLIIKKLTIKPEEVERVKQKYAHLFTKPTIGIGIRRGDFVKHGDFYQIPEDWYESALYTHFHNWGDYNVVIFSDEIEWCKNYYRDKGFYFADPNGTHTHADNFVHYHKDPMEQFILGTLMNNFIGGSSTFSWWQMWWVKNVNNGIVIHSGKNISDNSKHYKHPDYYPENWILHNV
jgi:hypothetical protein